MKKLLIPLISLGLLSTSCNKDDADATNCDETVAAIAGKYALTKLEQVTGTSTVDISSTITPCIKSATFMLRADKTFNVTSPSGGCDYEGTWDVSSGIMITGDGSIGGSINNKCTHITLTTLLNNVTTVGTYTRI